MNVGLVLLLTVPSWAAWTEQDESRRIAQLKQQESRAFEMQMRGQNPFVAGSNNGYYGSQSYYGQNGMYDNYQNSMSAAYQNGHYSSYPEKPINTQESAVHKVPIESRKAHASELRADKPANVQTVVEVKTKTWCYHCASPWQSINADMQQAMRNLLEIRRARFPATSYVRADCSHPKNVSDLPKQQCSIGYCQTLVLTDHDSASALTIRGCAEKFGAVDEREFERRADNTCKKLHQTVDIQECICRNRKYCYSGSARDYGYKEEAETNFYKCVKSHTSSTVSSSLAILLLSAGLRILFTFI
ncbi:hypothetical protein M3Y97_00274800 [Aphelenchoides bicaudatus]|nr:hypothetical protein M3Y97_00274800 [Aphelenchoides bicaudatus]